MDFGKETQNFSIFDSAPPKHPRALKLPIVKRETHPISPLQHLNQHQPHSFSTFAVKLLFIKNSQQSRVQEGIFPLETHMSWCFIWISRLQNKNFKGLSIIQIKEGRKEGRTQSSVSSGWNASLKRCIGQYQILFSTQQQCKHQY